MSSDDCSDSNVSISESGSEDESENDVSSELSDEDESDDSTTALHAAARQWVDISNVKSVPTPPRFTFTGDSKLNFHADNTEDVLQYFELFFDDTLMDMIALETNRYAQSNTSGFRRIVPYRQREWIPTTKNELRVFFAIIILQSLIKKPSHWLYWTKRSILETPFFGRVISYKRFCQLKQNLHFCDNSTYNAETHPNPKLNKIWDIYTDLNKKFQSLYNLERDVTIDESLLLYKGRLGWIQYIPKKRARFGIKTYMLCEASSGYIWSSIIYTGKDTVFDDDYKHLPVSSRIVMSLMKPLLNKGHCVTTDNFYTSPTLADLLLANRTDTYGTMKPNRKDLPSGLKKKLKKNEVIAYQRGKALAIKWRDKRDVCLLSTVHNPEMVSVERRGEKVMKPKLVQDYNNTMGGVDRADQHLADYPLTRKRGKKYYKKIFSIYLNNHYGILSFCIRRMVVQSRIYCFGWQLLKK